MASSSAATTTTATTTTTTAATSALTATSSIPLAKPEVPTENEVVSRDLPITFKVKYLGSENATGLWGIKHTRRPVDHLVSIAKTLPSNKTLPLCSLTISLDGVNVETTSIPQSDAKRWTYAIDSISYGVQDLVYTRVFSMIIVKENYTIKDENPFEVHAFVCDSRALARKLTYALAASFQEYSKRVKALELSQQQQQHSATAATDPAAELGRKKFAIDLRTPEEMQQEIDELETEA